MMIGAEDFWFLLHNTAHWEFEIFLMIIFDVVIGMIAWPFIKHLVREHDKKKHLPCDEFHMDLPEKKDHN